MNLLEEVRSLARAVAIKAVDRRIAWGQITSVSPDVEVRFAGDTTSVVVDNWLSSYTPADTDRVALVKFGASWIIVGKVVNA